VDGIIEVEANGENGQVMIKAKSVIIATGGYDGNKELMNKFCHEYVDVLSDKGVPGKLLDSTLKEYNEVCDSRYDDIFVKDSQYLQALRTPPYYAVIFKGALLATVGGIKSNHKMEVPDRDFNPIPGIYAAGSDTGGWESGTAFGFALSSGRIAAENAADYIKRKE